MKKKNIILIVILAFSIFPLFFIGRVVAASGYVWIYPDGDYSAKWSRSNIYIDWYEHVRPQTEEDYIYVDDYVGGNQGFYMDDVSLTNKHILNVVLYAYCIPNGARDIKLKVKIAGTSYISDIITVSGGGWRWETYSASKDSGCWTDANIDGMRAYVEAFNEESGDVYISRMKVKVYWNDICP
ncbi:MAG: hypothetical protein ACXACO_08125 [Promethearchaeota archaeon]|jgi:hypothetical protein